LPTNWVKQCKEKKQNVNITQTLQGWAALQPDSMYRVQYLQRTIEIHEGVTAVLEDTVQGV